MCFAMNLVIFSSVLALASDANTYLGCIYIGRGHSGFALLLPLFETVVCMP